MATLAFALVLNSTTDLSDYTKVSVIIQVNVLGPALGSLRENANERNYQIIVPALRIDTLDMLNTSIVNAVKQSLKDRGIPFDDLLDTVVLR